MGKQSGLTGLNCPICGGMVSIPEGRDIIICEFCKQRLIVSGERGILRTQINAKTDQNSALRLWKSFLRSSSELDPTARHRAKLQDCFLIYMPFWQVRARVLGWIFGNVEVKVEDRKVERPVEYKIAEDFSWNNVAAEVGEFGVSSLNLSKAPQQPFDPEALHKQAMVFEPVGSQVEAREEARKFFERQINAMADIKRLHQKHLRFTGEQVRLIYVPLWVVRYSYSDRTFQVVVDGHSGAVVYGTGPGNTLNRALSLVTSAISGTIMMVDIPAILLWLIFNNLDQIDSIEGLLVAFGLVGSSFMAGIALLMKGYNHFRFGEQYTFKSLKKNRPPRFNSHKDGVTRLRV